MWMSFEKHTSKHDLIVEIKGQSLKVVYRNQTCLDGELAHTISVASSTWALSDGKLEVSLSKKDKSVNWNHLILSDLRGQKVIDADTATEWHHRLIRMTAEEMVLLFL